jgi:hypothetical protein
MKKYIFVFLLFLIPIGTFAMETDLWIGNFLGGYGAGLTEQIIYPFYLSESVSLNLLNLNGALSTTSNVPVFSLNQGVGSDFIFNSSWVDVDLRTGITGSMLFFNGGNAIVLWGTLRGGLNFSNFGIFAGADYEIVGINPISGLSWPDRWVHDFGIDYRW